MTHIKKTRHRIFQALAVCWFIVITYLFLMPTNNVPRFTIYLGIPLDKVVHFGSFFITAFLLFISFPHSHYRFHLIIIFLLTLYAILIEVLQAAMRMGRAFEWSDFVFDMIGVLTAYGVYSALSKIMYPRDK